MQRTKFTSYWDVNDQYTSKWATASLSEHWTFIYFNPTFVSTILGLQKYEQSVTLDPSNSELLSGKPLQAIYITTHHPNSQELQPRMFA